MFQIWPPFGHLFGDRNKNGVCFSAHPKLEHFCMPIEGYNRNDISLRGDFLLTILFIVNS